MKDTSESDLQKAIDDIARANGGTSGGATEEQPAATVPVTTSATNGQTPPAPEPVTISAPAPEEVTAPPADPAPAPEMPKPEESSDVAVEGVPEEPKADDYSQMDSDEVKEKAIEDLTPIINTVDLKPILPKIDLLPETKFKIYKSIIETTRDKGALGLAYATAKDIVNDDARAEALLYIVEMTEKL